jgi:hypothetical protein
MEQDMTKDEALDKALEALELNNSEWKSLADSGDAGFWLAEEQEHYKQTEAAITAIKQARSAPMQEPVACHICGGSGFIEFDALPEREKNNGKWGRCLNCQPYTTPPAAPVQEPVWIQPDHLQKAQKAPFLCRVEPHKRDDFVPLYTTPPAAQPTTEESSAVKPAAPVQPSIKQGWDVDTLLDKPAAQPANKNDGGAVMPCGSVVTNVYDAYDVGKKAAAQRQWVGLDFSEVDELAREMIKGDKSVNWLAFSIDAKLKEKNT